MAYIPDMKVRGTTDVVDVGFQVQIGIKDGA